MQVTEYADNFNIREELIEEDDLRGDLRDGQNI